MTLTAIKPAEFPWFPYEGFTFCLGLTEGEHAWTSGHTGAPRSTRPSARCRSRAPWSEQAAIAYAKCLTILEAAGCRSRTSPASSRTSRIAGLPHYDEAAGGAPRALRRPPARRRHRRRRAPGAPHGLPRGRAARRPGGGELLLAASEDARGRHLAPPPRSREGHDGAVYLPTVLPIDADGDVVAPGDFVGAVPLLPRAGRRAARAGRALAGQRRHDLRLLHPGHPRASTAKTHRVRKELLGSAGVYPGAGGILMSQLHAPGALVAIDVDRLAPPARAGQPGLVAATTRSPTPRACKAGRTLFMSGFAALDMETQEALYPGDLGRRPRTPTARSCTCSRHAGLGPEDLLATIEYCVESATRQLQGRRRGARAAAVRAVAGLDRRVCDGLLRPEFLLEVFPTALYPPRRADEPAHRRDLRARIGRAARLHRAGAARRRRRPLLRRWRSATTTRSTPTPAYARAHGPGRA